MKSLTRIIKYSLLANLCCFYLIGCSQTSDEEYERALMRYHGAKEVRLVDHKGTKQLTYRLVEAYPAIPVINWLSEQLTLSGWKPLPNYYLNPDIKAQKEWSKIIDSRSTPTLYVHRWTLDWEHSSGSVVSYSLEYKYPENSTTPDLMNLEVIAIYVPKVIVDKERGTLQKLRGQKG